MLFDRHLTDAAGGNISVRVNEWVCLTPRYSGQKKQWHLSADDVLVLDAHGNRVPGFADNGGALSRESQVHLGLLNTFAAGQAVIHAHPRHVLVFCAARKPIAPVLEATQKFGAIKVTEFAPAHSADLAKHVIAGLRGQEERIRKNAAAVLAPWHGIFCIGKDIEAAFDAVERIDTNAHVLLMGAALGTSFVAEQAQLVEALARYH
jgi:L-fuculose-phosphate aldolase